MARVDLTGRMTALRGLHVILLAGGICLLHPSGHSSVAAEQSVQRPPAGQDTTGTPAGQDTTGTPAGQDTTGTGGGRALGQESARPRSSLRDSIEAHFTTLDTDGDITTFHGSAERAAVVRYRDMELTAGIIIYDTSSEEMTAIPLPDTSSTGQGQSLHRPVFRQGDQQVVGDRMMYSLRSESGSVFGADTAYELGYYHGRRINAITDDPDYLTVRDASFSTCDLEEPHYHFSADLMKIIPDDKVVAKGIRANLLGVQIPPKLFTIFGIDIFPAFPFLVKSIRSGRQSGPLMPKYGNNSLTGVTLNDVGYYWAPSEYFDLRSAADLTETQGIILRNRLRYGVRYLLQGNVDFSYNYRRASISTPAQTRTELRFNHSQQIDPTLRVVAQGNFSSSQFRQKLSQNLPDRLERVLRSHLNFSKRFENGSNLSGTLSQTRFLDRGSSETQFPTLNFRVPRRPLFGADKEESSLGSGSGFGFSFGAEDEGPELPDWRENFYIDYGAQLISRSEKLEAPNPDTTNWGTRSQGGLEQRANLTYSGKAMGWLNLQPTLNVREDWYFGDSVPDSLGGFQRRLLWTSSLRASTKLYGIAEQPFGIGASFRHVVEPSISLNYQPDFTDQPDVPTLFGGNPGPQRSLSFGLGQIFQMKRQVGDQERKTDLARINTSGAYNAEGRGRKLSDISSSLNMNPGRVLSLQLNASHRFYDEADQFQWTPTLLRANLRSSLRLDSAVLGSLLGIGVRSAPAAEAEEEDPEGAETAQAQEQEQPEQPFGSPTAESDRLIDRRQPARAGRLWSLSLGHDYGWARGLGGTQDDRTHSLDGSLTFNLPKTTFTLTARYDFVRKEMVRQTLTIHRDLHCWEARLQVVPTGPGRGYWFVIGVKEIPEIKYERRQTTFGR